MLKRLIRSLIATVIQLAVAFFFATIILFTVSVFIKDKVDLLFSVTNKFAIQEKIGEKVEVKYDLLKKRLANQPAYGTVWARLIIPDINLNLEVKHGDDLDIIKTHVGHYAGSYFPGEGGSIILPAHNNSKQFMYISRLKEGSEITIEADYGTFVYRVYETKIIQETDKDSLPIQSDEEILMLYTCYPVTGLGHKDKRFVVYAKLESAKFIGETNEE